MSEVEETLQRIKSNGSVQGYIIINFEGAIIKSTFAAERKEEGELIAKNYHQLCLKAKSIIRDLDPINDLTFLRLKSKNNEIMIAPDKDFILIVVQGENQSEKKDNDD